MPITPRERLARVLDGSQPTGAFSAQLSVPARDVRLTVAGAGPISFPVRAPQAKRMIASARPARFGRGEQTLMDLSVRDTWEITPDQVTLTGLDWDAILAEVRDELGLPARARLRAEPHALLVYGKGQFFLPHQDSEKDDAMVGTLVVSLPSAHAGGELIVEHGGESVTYRTSKQDLSFVAFYADCRHEVKPVTSGYRVTLTFNLLADGEADAQGSGLAADLARCLTEHFATPATPRYGRTDLDPPNRLVYLLDHEYTQRGLNWNRLKGADAERAALLRAAAERAGCEAALALAEVKETWDAWPSDGDPWDDYDYYDEEDEDGEEDYDDGVSRGRGGDHDDYQLNELIDDEITLGWWTSPDGTGGEPISLHVPDSEVCATTPSADLVPYQSEYEGYMGNYGNTLDRWYRRAAVVVWPLDRAFAARAEAGSQWALSELRTRIEAGDLEGARAGAESLAPFWKKIGSQAGLLGTALHVAAGLGAAETAAMLLEPFRVETVAPEHAGGLAAAGQYGEEWTRGVIAGWFGPGHYLEADRYEWVERLPGLCAALRAAGGPEVARLLAAGAWGWMGDQLRLWTTTARTAPESGASGVFFGPRARRTNRLGQNLEVVRDDYHLANRAHAHAFAAHFSFAAQREMDDAPLAAVHGAEVERLAGFLDTLGRGEGAHAQLFDAQNAIVVGVKTDARMVFVRHAQRFHGQLFERQQELGFVAEEQVDVGPAEADHDVGILKIGVRRFALADRVSELEPGEPAGFIQEFRDPRRRL